MLRIIPQTSAAAAKSYYAVADYYSQGQETVGHWYGRAAERLGLHGAVTPEQFAALCDNVQPDGSGQPLTPRTKSNRRILYDFNYSAPKGVSLLYGLTGDDGILTAYRESVHETMLDVEANMQVRVRKHGQDFDRRTGNAVWAELFHYTSRPVDGIPDPHLHAHCTVFSYSWDEVEQTGKAAQFGDLKRNAPYYQALFRAHLAEKLSARGYAIDVAKGDFDIAGLEATTRKFQRRTDQIEAEATRRGITAADIKAELGAKTREAKTPELPWPDLRQQWLSRLDDNDRRALRTAYARPGPRTLARAEGQAVDYAICHLFERDAVVPEKDLLAEALRYGLGAVTVQGVHDALRQANLLGADRDGRRLLTTPAIVAEEQRLIAFARDGRGTRKPLGPAHRSFRRDWLNADQRAAVRHIWDSCDRVVMVRGAAGVGKTTLLQEAVEGIEAGGRQVFAFAPSAGAARGVLRQEGFADAETVARLLVDPELQEAVRGQVILIDEAGLLGTRDMARLFDLARAKDARVLLVGDRRQHGAVERSGALRLLETRAGLRVAEVTEIQRQKDVPGYKAAVELLAAGQPAAGLQALDQLGWVLEVEDGQREQQLAAAYLEVLGQRKKNGAAKTALIVAPTHAEGERLTAVIRAERQQRGQLADDEHEVLRLDPLHWTQTQRGEARQYTTGEVIQFFQNARGFKAGERVTVVERQNNGVLVQTAAGGVKDLPLDQAGRFQVFRAGRLPLAAGDRVRIPVGGKTKDGQHRVETGSLYTLAGFTKSGDLLLENGWTLAKEYGLAHGYTVTSFAAQGKTVDQVFVGQSAASFPASSREQLYVSVSRGREKAVLYTSNKEELREAVQRSEERLTARELVGDQPNRRNRLLKFVDHLRRWARVARETTGRLQEAARPQERNRERERGLDYGR